ncbi:unnamed protein product, partial [Prunus brigantina]
RRERKWGRKGSWRGSPAGDRRGYHENGPGAAIRIFGPGGQTGGLDDDVAEEQLGQRPKTKEELLAVAFNEVIPRDEVNKYRHLKPLYISAHVEGVPISKVFVDCGATVNILPCSLMRKLAKTREDLIPSDVIMSSFFGDKSKTIVVLPLKITVADQTRIAAFYVVESSVDYNILLGRDWIHQAGTAKGYPYTRPTRSPSRPALCKHGF